MRNYICGPIITSNYTANFRELVRYKCGFNGVYAFCVKTKITLTALGAFNYIQTKS